MKKQSTLKILWGTACAFIMVLVSSGCMAFSQETPTPPLPTATLTPTATAIPIVEEAQPTSGPVTLNIWLPPEFDPNQFTLASRMFNARLAEFISRRSEVDIQIRIKDPAGPGGIEDTLQTANAAAPVALPDLVALPYETLQSAAAKGLLHPFDGLTAVMDDPDWYEFARQLSHVQNSIFGIPFAGDALVMFYRPAVTETPPTDWLTMLEQNTAISFPAADPDSLLTLMFYQSSGGAIVQDDQTILEMPPLTDVLNFYYQANRNEVIPFWLTQFETDEQAWTAYEEGQADLAISWVSRYLQTQPADSDIAVIPTSDGIPYTTATGWVWALVSADPERQEIVAQLVEFLTTAEYLAEWSEAAGYLPPRPNAMLAWAGNLDLALLDQVSSSAQLAPSSDVTAVLGPVLNEVTIDVLKEQTDPATAAQKAIEGLIAP